MKPILADLHTHSIGSIHAYNTIDEILDKTDIPYVAITDHVQDVGDTFLKHNMSEYINHMRRCYSEVDKLIVGAELDVDIPVKSAGIDLGRLDISILSYHCNSPKLTLDSFVKAIDTYKPTIIGHPYRYAHEEDKKVWDAIVAYAAEKGCIIELNGKSYAEVNIKHIQQLNCSLSLGSDAHVWRQVGQFKPVRDFVDTYFATKHIVNCDQDWLQDARKGAFTKIEPLKYRTWNEKVDEIVL